MYIYIERERERERERDADADADTDTDTHTLGAGLAAAACLSASSCRFSLCAYIAQCQQYVGNTILYFRFLRYYTIFYSISLYFTAFHYILRRYAI